MSVYSCYENILARAKNILIDWLKEMGAVKSEKGRVRLTDRDEFLLRTLRLNFRRVTKKIGGAVSGRERLLATDFHGRNK